MARRKLTIPLTLAFAVAGVGAAVGLAACGDDDDDPPQECTVEGMCPSDGKICLDEQTQTQPCCPICPSDGTTCPSGCVLTFPPI